MREAGALVGCLMGRVVGIIRRNWQPRGYCGSLESPKFKTNPGRNVRALFRPKKKNVPPVWIRTSQLQQLLGKRVVCVMDSWENDSRFPSGHYVKMIGNTGDKEAETVSYKPCLKNLHYFLLSNQIILASACSLNFTVCLSENTSV